MENALECVCVAFSVKADEYFSPVFPEGDCD